MSDCAQLLLSPAAVSGCLPCTEILWDFNANLDVQDGVGCTVHFTVDKSFFISTMIMIYVTVSGRSHPTDFGSPDEQSGAVRLPPGPRLQCEHPGQRGKVLDPDFYSSSADGEAAGPKDCPVYIS